MTGEGERRGRRDADHVRWSRAALSGGAVGLLLQAWMLTAGTWNPVRWGRQADLYDVQARALLDGTFAMDQRVLGIESFARGDQHFMYFGPIPALLRLPIVAATRSFDGRLAAISMFGALVVTLVAVCALGWNLRRRVVGDDDAPVTRSEAIAVGAVMFTVVGASSLLYASARTAIYHEAILWGVALTMATLALLLRWLDLDDINTGRAHRLLALTSMLAALALLTRPSVAGGALAAFGLVAATTIVPALRPSHRAGGDPAPVTSGLLVGAVVMPVVAYVAVNWIKFRQLLGVPFDQQGYTLLSEQRREMLAANGGSLFNAKFVPTNLVTYLRPDLVGIDGTFPFLQPRRPSFTIGSPVYDLIDLTAGLPVTMPLLIVLAGIGCWLVARSDQPRLRAVRSVVVGTALGTVAVLAIGYLANRYQSDFLPPLIVGAFVGLPIVARWYDSLATERVAARRTVVGGAALLLLIGLATNLALGYSYQRAYGPSTHPNDVAHYLATQQRIDGWFGDGLLPTVDVVDELPASSRIGDVAILGACDALYLSDGGAPSDGRLTQWRLAELAPDRGASRGDLRLESGVDVTVVLVELATAQGPVSILVETDRSRGVMTAVVVAATSTTSTTSTSGAQRGPDLALVTGRAVDWEVYADGELGRLEVYLDGRFAAYADLPVGDPGLESTAGATVRVDPRGTPVCDRLLADMATEARAPRRR